MTSGAKLLSILPTFGTAVGVVGFGMNDLTESPTGELVDKEAQEIGELFQQSKNSLVDSVKYLWHTGDKLKAKKYELGHGNFLPWLEKNRGLLGFGVTTAGRLMKLSNCALAHNMEPEEALAISRSLWGHAVNRYKIEVKEVEPPSGEYSVIYADPPWRYEFSKSDSREIENQYPTMSEEELCKLPIPATKNCTLFMWATSPKLDVAMRVMEAWGFKYKTCAVWDKQKIGMGYYFRQQHELLLVGTIGSPPVPEPSDRVSSVISAPREAHSKKPERLYELIESMYPGGSKIELFCRKPREGWASWGNQV